ncbi:hypothetical protein [Streptomyces lasalocidi]|uniref:Uncharacterized protein n=1 Tax=Streptomyces lasalocidi TaxID=324833 RepID=A0A4U5WAL8_STRLS|nr:hypothetical protein [Streptomyces lasalocidi]TKS98688.1 hypothetical protein E4U91_00015 [Streptomyces lasalocidi]
MVITAPGDTDNMSVHDLIEVRLDRHQAQLLAMIGRQQAMDPEGQWPVWSWVEYQAKANGMNDPRGVLTSLPRVGGSETIGPSYGFSSAVPRILAADTRIALTVAAAVAVEEQRSDLGIPFLMVLRHMINMWRSAPRFPNEVAEVTLTSEALQQALPHMRPRIIRLIPGYFSCEPFLGGSHSRQQDGSWTMEVRDTVMHYEHATDLLGYVREACGRVRQVRREVEKDWGIEPAEPTQPLDTVRHISASRSALLLWLWHQKQHHVPGEPMPSVLDVLLDERFAMDQGVRFTDAEIDRAAAHLEQHALINSGGTFDQKIGPVVAEITVAGEDCVENYNGDVSAYVHQKHSGAVTFHIATNTGNIAANSTAVTQHSVTQDAAGPAKILAAVSLIRQLAPALTTDTDQQQNLLASVDDLQAAAEDSTSDGVAVRHLADGVCSALRNLTQAPDVQRLALEAVEQAVGSL